MKTLKGLIDGVIQQICKRKQIKEMTVATGKPVVTISPKCSGRVKETNYVTQLQRM